MQRCHQTGQRRLPTAALPHQPERLARRQREAHVLHRPDLGHLSLDDRPPTYREVLDHILHFEESVARGRHDLHPYEGPAEALTPATSVGSVGTPTRSGGRMHADTCPGRRPTVRSAGAPSRHSGCTYGQRLAKGHSSS